MLLAPLGMVTEVNLFALLKADSPSELHENIPPLPEKFFSRLTCPATAWPKYCTRCTVLQTEERIINLRQQGNNRCEIRDILRENAASIPGSTAICNICRRHGLNKLHRVQKQERRKIIMNRIGESVHIDCHQLSDGITAARPGVEVLEAKKEDFIEDALYGCIDDLKNELSGFLVCYNEHGPHSAIGNIPPAKRLNR
jgi:hypothetical protein